VCLVGFLAQKVYVTLNNITRQVYTGEAILFCVVKQEFLDGIETKFGLRTAKKGKMTWKVNLFHFARQ
jgi:hypothetical protein